MFHPCKVTVMKRTCDMELVQAYVKEPEKFSICNQVKDGQEFIVHNPYVMPDGLCPHAWADIRSQILVIATGGRFALLKEENMAIAACTDPFRPVVFTVEKIGK